MTGGTGYLGSELVRRGAEGVSTRDFDVRDHEDVRDAFEQRRPDVVIHTACRQDPPDARSVNVDGSTAVAQAAAAVAARLIHMSTDVVFSGRQGRYTEDDPPDPVTDYGRTKRDAELAVGAWNPKALIVPTSLLYGILHVAAEQAVSRCELARALAGREVPCTTTAAAGVTRPLNCTLDSSRARALLRTPLRPLREALT